MPRNTSRALGPGPLALALATALLVLAGSARADDAIYEIKRSDVKVAPGAKGTATVTIAVKAPWHVNVKGDGAPLTLKLTPDAGLKVDKEKMELGDLADKNQSAPRFDIGVVGAEAGKKTINAELRFVMCQETACKPVKEKFAMNVEVAAAPPPAAPAKGKAKK